MFDESAVQQPGVQITPKQPESRRRNCVICSNPVKYNYMTSFTSVPERQKQWLRILTNGDSELMASLFITVTKARKYICFDHFGKETIRYKHDGTPELIRNSLPMPYIPSEFQQNCHLKEEFLEDRLREKIFSVLVDAANHYIEESMNSISHVQ